MSRERMPSLQMPRQARSLDLHDRFSRSHHFVQVCRVGLVSLSTIFFVNLERASKVAGKRSSKTVSRDDRNDSERRTHRPNQSRADDRNFL
jgi:hypothetical protein